MRMAPWLPTLTVTNDARLDAMDPEPASIKVLLIARSSLLREAIRLALDEQSGVEVVADISEGTHVVSEVERARPDVALLMTSRATREITGTVATLCERMKGCRILVISEDEDEDLLLAVLEAGATGYLTNRSPVEDLVRGIHAVYEGETVVPPHMVGALLRRFIHRRREQDLALRRMSRLTAREREVLILLARGSGNDAIAETLVISPKTARTHIQNLISKLGVHSRLEAAMFLTRSGISDELLVDGMDVVHGSPDLGVARVQVDGGRDRDDVTTSLGRV
jgi:DNA-binding NarL/FixJ family response regulator